MINELKNKNSGIMNNYVVTEGVKIMNALFIIIFMIVVGAI